MPRNAEVIRQWTILREIERARGAGVTIDELASLCSVTTRTIRRDLQALEESGFPLYDDKTHDDGKTRWRVNGQAFKGLSAGLTVSELCALYFSRTLLESLSGTPFRDDVESAFEKLSSVLTPHMRQFLDQLPRVIATKADPMRRHDNPRQQQFIARALEATLQLRQANLTYHSKSSERTKTYLVHPYRLAYAQGGLYLLAYVPEYQRGAHVRGRADPGRRRCSRSASRRSKNCRTRRSRTRSACIPGRPSASRSSSSRRSPTTCGRASGIRRSSCAMPASGGLTLTLDVCLDRALQSWILSFGPFARVVAPARAGARDRGTVRRSESEVRIMTTTAVTAKTRLKHAKKNIFLAIFACSSCLRGSVCVLACVLWLSLASNAFAATKAIRAGKVIDAGGQGDRQRRDPDRRRSHHLDRHRARRRPAPRSST